MWILLLACRHAPDSEGPAESPPDSPAESPVDSEPLPELVVDECDSGGLAVGVHEVEGADGVLRRVIVKPFGWKFGLDRGEERLEAPPWIPEVQGITDPPLLTPSPESWDAQSVAMPSFVELDGQGLLFYGGAADEVAYSLGVALRQEGGSFQKFEGNPILEAAETGALPGDWDYDSQNTPETLLRDGQLWLYYNGGDDSIKSFSVGLARSDNGLDFTKDLDNPLLEGLGERTFEGGARAHATVVERDGVVEMWFASGTLEIGYAISIDGVHFEEYCGGPVFRGNGPKSWDAGEVKAPDVWWDGQSYWMVYSGGGKGNYQVGWAASRDGLHWAAAPDPILAPQPDTWNAKTTQGASLEVDEEAGILGFWFAGNDDVSLSIGRAWAEMP